MHEPSSGTVKVGMERRPAQQECPLVEKPIWLSAMQAAAEELDEDAGTQRAHGP
jgi:hypothetical protein